MKKLINKDLIKIIISIILVGIYLIFKSKYLLIISYLIVSYDIYIKAYKNILKKEFFDENILMILATLGAFYINSYLEGVMVILLYQIGEYLSDLAINKSKTEITKLLDLRVDTVTLKDNTKLDIKKVKINDIFIVKPGEKIALDALVIGGVSYLDTSSMTGESILQKVKKNDFVLSGTLNTSSTITLKALKTYESTTTTKILELIENSNSKKTNTEKFITKFSKIYTPIIVILAFLIVIVSLLLKYNLKKAIYKAIVFLVVSCPCALVISVPLGFFCGIGRASKDGILVKGSNELELLSKIKNIVFDKTGTITEGVFEVSKINSNSEENLLEIAAYAEYYSIHPIATSIITKYNKKINRKRISNFTEIPGKGIKVDIDKDHIIIGNKKLFSNISEIEDLGTTIYVSKNNKYLGNIVISDVIKKEAFSLTKRLSSVGINNIIMLSGDSNKEVEKVCQKIDIKNYYGNLLPDEKLEKVLNLKKKGITSFVGDGVNDALVIKESDIGIAMGANGSDVSIYASDVVLLKDDLNKIIDAVNIAKRTVSVVKLNIVLAIVVKVIILLLSVFNISNIYLAIFADVGITLITVMLASLIFIRRK